MDPFEINSGSNRLANLNIFAAVFISTILVTLLVSKTGIIGFIGVIGLLFAIALIYMVFNNPINKGV
jgi:hypothetical protein